MKTNCYSFLIIGLLLFSCAKKTDLKNSKLIPIRLNEKEFIGTKQEYAQYIQFFVPQSVSKMNDQEYEAYIQSMNSVSSQEKFLQDSKKWKMDAKKAPKMLETDGIQVEARAGKYPETMGYVLVTDNPCWRY